MEESFLIFSVSGRMALLVTLFLVLVNIFNSVTANSPKAEGSRYYHLKQRVQWSSSYYPSLLTEMMMAALKGLTAVETWVVSCIIHVFGVLAEYALILKMIQSMKRREAEEKKKEQREMRKQIEQERRSVNCGRFDQLLQIECSLSVLTRKGLLRGLSHKE